jgi:two-component system, NarL family, response regulator DegU
MQRGGVVRIFLVDDNPTMRAQLRSVLEKRQDWKVVGEAEDGRGAIETWGDHAPSVTVMDFVMPVMSGLEAGRNLSKWHPESPVLMVTIDPSPQLEEEARKAGIKGLVQKADVRSLLQAIEILLQGGTYFHQRVGAA